MADRLLIKAVHTAAVTDAPLDRLTAAAVKSAELAAEADVLIDHFVAEARTAGHSWTEIGERLGVTKQAVRERFGERVDVSGRERFMPRLRHCVNAAGVLAREYGAAEVGTAHLLVALASNDGVASTVLDRLGAVPATLAAAFHDDLGSGHGGAGDVPESRPPESRDLVDALRAATLFAFERGHDYVGTEHVLFVLASDPGSRTRRVLEHLGIGLADIKRELARCLTIEPARRRRRRRHLECRCSFCGATDIASLVHGPGVWICRTCARIALDVTTALPSAVTSASPTHRGTAQP